MKKVFPFLSMCYLKEIHTVFFLSLMFSDLPQMQKNSTVSNYLDGFTYGLFQQMADQYVQSEVPNKKTQLPVVAPELVKFAFTLDFTARVANLHHQATGQIMGFGNQYLQDHFTHMSESHPHLSDIKAEDQKTQNSDQEFISL